MELSREQLESMGVTPAQLTAVGAQGFKSQAWMLYDTVASKSFLVGGDEPNIGEQDAIGTNAPAISTAGEVGFFDQGRTKSNAGVFYTNMDVSGSLSYGMEVWGIYVTVLMPSLRLIEDDGAGGIIVPFPRVSRLGEALINGAVMSVQLGQEFEQILAPNHKFGSGGAYITGGDFLQNPVNGLPTRQNVMVLPEPIEMPRTQNIGCKMQLSGEALKFIGNGNDPGVGLSLPPVITTFTDAGGNAVQIDVAEMPFGLQVGLIGKRIKHVQYGQTAGG